MIMQAKCSLAGNQSWNETLFFSPLYSHHVLY